MLTDPETGERLDSPTQPWPSESGDAQRRRMVELLSFHPNAGDIKSRELSIGPRFPDRDVDAMVYGSARLLYTQGDFVVSTTLSGGRKPNERKLASAVPRGTWRLLAGQGRLYVALKNEVHVLQVAGLKVGNQTIPGVFVHQMATRDGCWYGVQTVGDKFTLVQVTPDGERHEFDLQLYGGARHVLLETDGLPTVVGSSGEVLRLEEGLMRTLRAGNPADKLLTCASAGGVLLALLESQDAYRLLTFPEAGAPREVVLNGAASMSDQMVVFDKSVFLFQLDPNMVKLREFNLEDFAFGNDRPLGCQRLVSAIGYSSPESQMLIVAGVSQGHGQVRLIEPSTMHERLLCNFAQNLAAVHLLVADRWIVVGQTGESFRTLLSYEM
jgi:hypothetical protein